MKPIFGLAKTLHLFNRLFQYILRSHLPQADFKKLKAGFTTELLKTFNLKVNVTGNPTPHSSSAIYVCNHISYIDIPLILNLLPHVSFVSKQEVAQWPLIGQAASRIDTIFVKRESKDSRSQTREALRKALLEEKKHVVVFPSGTTKIVKADSWRKGIFEIAQNNNIPVIPLRLNYQPLRQVAYIDQDTLLTHMLALASHGEIITTLEIGAPRMITDAVADCQSIQEWCELQMLAPQNRTGPVTNNNAELVEATT